MLIVEAGKKEGEEGKGGEYESEKRKEEGKRGRRKKGGEEKRERKRRRRKGGEKKKKREEEYGAGQQMSSHLKWLITLPQIYRKLKARRKNKQQQELGLFCQRK